MRALIVEDERKMAEVLKKGVEERGHAVTLETLIDEIWIPEPESFAEEASSEETGCWRLHFSRNS